LETKPFLVLKINISGSNMKPNRLLSSH